jgi:hypothetical protein
MGLLQDMGYRDFNFDISGADRAGHTVLTGRAGYTVPPGVVSVSCDNQRNIAYAEWSHIREGECTFQLWFVCTSWDVIGHLLPHLPSDVFEVTFTPLAEPRYR